MESTTNEPTSNAETASPPLSVVTDDDALTDAQLHEDIATTTASTPPAATVTTSSAASTSTNGDASQVRFSAAKGRKGRDSSKYGTVNYEPEEMHRLNEAVRAVMPLGCDDWINVAVAFNYRRPGTMPLREVDSLKRKFKKMYCSHVLDKTGLLPDYIVEAKALRRLIHTHTQQQQRQRQQQQQQEQQRDGDATDVVSSHDGQLSAQQLGLDNSTNDDNDSIITDAQLVATDDDTLPAAAAAAALAAAKLLLSDQQQPLQAAATSAAAASTPLLSFQNALAATDPTTQTTAAQVVALLQHSIDRKRRSVSDETIHANERVRKERKKRRMERALRNAAFHHDQQRSERSSRSNEPALLLLRSNAAAAAPPSVQASVAPVSMPAATLPLLSTSAPAPAPTSVDAILAFLVAQQRDQAAQRARDDVRRLHAQQRRRANERRQRDEMRQVIRAVAAALEDKCPAELHRWLAQSNDNDDDDDESDEDDDDDAAVLDGLSGSGDGKADRLDTATATSATKENGAQTDDALTSTALAGS